MLEKIISKFQSINVKSSDQEAILTAWNKAEVIAGHDPKEIRKDQCGAWIIFNDYKNTNTEHGWDINQFSEPLQWKNKRSHDQSDTKQNFCVVTSKGH